MSMPSDSEQAAKRLGEATVPSSNVLRPSEASEVERVMRAQIRRREYAREMTVIRTVPDDDLGALAEWNRLNYRMDDGHAPAL